MLCLLSALQNICMMSMLKDQRSSNISIIYQIHSTKSMPRNFSQLAHLLAEVIAMQNLIVVIVIIIIYTILEA